MYCIFSPTCHRKTRPGWYDYAFVKTFSPTWLSNCYLRLTFPPFTESTGINMTTQFCQYLTLQRCSKSLSRRIHVAKTSCVNTELHLYRPFSAQKTRQHCFLFTASTPALTKGNLSACLSRRYEATDLLLNWFSLNPMLWPLRKY